MDLSRSGVTWNLWPLLSDPVLYFDENVRIQPVPGFQVCLAGQAEYLLRYPKVVDEILGVR